MRRSTALLETTGRKSGRPRITPVTNGLSGDEFWMVTEHGGRAAYVRNIEADPRVRVKVGRHWRRGTAHLVDDPSPTRPWIASSRTTPRRVATPTSSAGSRPRCG